MDARRIIPIEVKDEYIIGAGRVIGAKGSHDDVVLRAAFNDMWDGTSKTAVWLNAIGEQAVVQMLLPDTKEDGAYLIPIPEEAKSEVGDAMLTIKGFTTADGVTEGSATITATAYFRVLEGDFDQGASDSGSITLNQSEQFQAQLTAIEADIINAAKAADAKEAAEQFANDAEGYAADADSAAKRANAAVYEAENWAWSASDDASTAAAASGKAETAAGRAETAAGRAETAAESASDSAGRAQQDLKTIEEDLLPQTEEFSTQAQWYRDEAADAKTAAQTASTNASRSATAANTSAGTAAEEAAKAMRNNEDIVDMIDGFGDTVEDAINRVNGVIADIDVHVEDAKAYAEGAWEAAEEAANSAGVASAKADAASTSAADAAREAARAKSNNEDIADMIDGFGDTVEAGKAEVNKVLQNVDEHVETAHSYAESAWEAAEAAEAAADRAENASGGTAGKDGEDGATFTPSVSSAGVISWTNDKGLTNPSPVNIKGAKGDKGDKGTTFTPSVSSDGTISWANDGGLTNPASVNVFDDIGLMSKNGGKMTSEDEEYETTLAPEKIRLENADSSTNEITATGIQLSVDGEEGKLITKLKQGELSFYHSLEDGEIVSGVVRGLAETTDETAAVPYGQFKAELENLSIESSGIATKKGTIVEINSNYDAP
ncbi:MAG: hypothetical protein IKD11_00360, partial [Oscillospiraceae bacterium]|nr:hypothetical protein [Oscillospiraceae bacterium]